MKAIETKGLTKYYKKKAAIQGIDLSIEEGEIYGFIGPNGAGKSTAIKVLLNFIRADAGTAQVMGYDSRKEALEIRRLCGYVSSDVRFYPNMTSMDIFNYVCDFHGLASQKKTISYFAELFDIDLYKKAGELSLGNKKKIAITASMLAEPKLLILDEPTNGLDPLIQHRLFQELKERNRNGMTIFLSSHDLNEIQTNASKAAFIREGRIVTVEDIKAEQTLGKVLELTGEGIQLPDSEDFHMLVQEKERMRILYTGELKAVLSFLQQEAICDFTISLPNLEDQFMRLYEKEAEK